MNKNFAKDQYNSLRIQKNNPIGKWRQLYIELLKESNFNSILEIGAGSPEFLINSGISKKMAIDYGSNFKEVFERNQIGLIEMDLNDENSNLKDIGEFDIVVCSDVFEHLISPLNILKMIKRNIKGNGILLSHVPNEFRIINMLNIMFRGKSSQIYHPWKNEYDDPHVRRFTKKGYNDFLNLEFSFNLYLSDIKYQYIPKFLKFLGIDIPYTLEPGPTFLSTNSEETFNRFKKIKSEIN